MKKQKKLIIIHSKNQEGNDPIAIFDDPALAGEFLSRPLAKGQQYEITEQLLNPKFSRENIPVWFLCIRPNAYKPKRVIRMETFSEENDAMNGYLKKVEGTLFMTVFANSKEQATKMGMEKMLELKTTGRWKTM